MMRFPEAEKSAKARWIKGLAKQPLPPPKGKSLAPQEKPAISEPEAAISIQSRVPPPRINSNIVYAAKTLHDTTEILAGCRERIVGEIVFIGHTPWVVDALNNGSATIKQVSGGKTDHISRQCDICDEPIMHENFIPSKVKAELEKQNNKQQTESENNMNPLTDIETFILKAIQNGKDDNKIVAACMGKTFAEPADAVTVVKAIARMRKLAAKGTAITAPAPKGKSIPAPKAKASKATRGDGIDRVDFLFELAKGGSSEAKMISEFKKQFGECSAHYTYIAGREFRRANKDSKPAKKVVAKSAPAPKGKGKHVPPVPAKKAAKPAPVAKTPPPPKAAPATDIPAQGEEVPQA